MLAKINLTPTAKKKPKFKATHDVDYCAIAWKYATAAVNDRQQKKHCRWVRLAAQRFIRDYRAKRKSWYFDTWYANDVCDFIEKLPHIEGTWDTPEITLVPAQIFILVNVFGFRKKKDGNRRFSDVYIEMARKGAKSTLTSGICLYCLARDDEVGPQVIIGATTFEQAKKVFTPARKMVLASQDLREAFDITAWAKSITCDQNGGFIQMIHAKSSTQDGWNPHVGVLDELHAHKERGLHDVIKSAFGGRKNSLMWRITTAGFNIHGVCFEQHTMVKKILQKIIEADHYFGIIFTLDVKETEDDLIFDDPMDSTRWQKANPLIGIIPTWDIMEGFAKEAIASPGLMGEFKTKRLNIWTTSKGGWLNMEKWNRLPGNAKIERGQKCWAGIDLAAVSDLTALILAWWVGSELNLVGKYYLPQSAVDKRNEIGDLTYKHWQEAGHLIIIPGERTDYDFIENDIIEACTLYDVQHIGFDPYNAHQTINNLTGEDLPVVEVRQGPRTMHPAMQEFERRLLGNEIRHDGNPILTWAASNVVLKHDSNMNKAPDKKNSMDKIDPIVAALNAVVLMIGKQEDKAMGFV